MQFIDDKRYRNILVKAYDGHDSERKRSRVMQVGTIDRKSFEFIPSASVKMTSHQKEEVEEWISARLNEKRLSDLRLEVQQIPETIEKWALFLREDKAHLDDIDFSKIYGATKMLKATLNHLGLRHSRLPKDFVLKVVTAIIVLPSLFIAY